VLLKVRTAFVRSTAAPDLQQPGGASVARAFQPEPDSGRIVSVACVCARAFKLRMDADGRRWRLVWWFGV
jgi:hypothetical protein